MEIIPGQDPPQSQRETRSVIAAWVAGLAAMVLGLAPFVFVRSDFDHTSAYAVVMALLGLAMGRIIWDDMRNRDADIDTRIRTVALTGATLVALAALINGLTAPATQLLHGSPGGVVKIGDPALTATFPRRAADTWNTYAVDVTAPQTEPVHAQPPLGRLLGSSLLVLVPKSVASISAQTAGGAQLTVTQPAGASFLSPLLIFPKQTEIASLTLPADAFALPAAGRNVRAFLVTPELARDPRVAHVSGGRAGLLLAVDDARDRPVAGGIGFAAAGQATAIGGVVFTPKITTFPDLLVVSVPAPLPTLLGTLAFLIAVYVALQRASAAMRAYTPKG